MKVAIVLALVAVTLSVVNAIPLKHQEISDEAVLQALAIKHLAGINKEAALQALAQFAHQQGKVWDTVKDLGKTYGPGILRAAGDIVEKYGK